MKWNPAEGSAARSAECRQRTAFYLNLLIIAFAVIGTILMLFFPGEQEEFLTNGIGNFKYFTVLSNECCGIVAVVSLVRALRGKPRPMLAKLLAAAAVGLTFLTVVAFLGPLYGMGKMYLRANFFFHLVLPLTAMAEFVLCPGYEVSLRHTPLSMLPVALYGTVYLSNNLINGIGEWPDTNDFYGFLNWGLPIGLVIFAVLMLATWGIACALRAVRRRIA